MCFTFSGKVYGFWPKVICNFRPINKVLCSFIKSQHVWIILKYNKRTWSRWDLGRFKKECSIGKLQNSLIFGSLTMSSKALVIIFQWEQILTKLNKFQVFSYCNNHNNSSKTRNRTKESSLELELFLVWLKLETSLSPSMNDILKICKEGLNYHW